MSMSAEALFRQLRQQMVVLESALSRWENGYAFDVHAGERFVVPHTRAMLEELEALTAPPAVAVQGAVAWMTHHEVPLIFPTREEAERYCDDDEQPIPLFAHPPTTAGELADLKELEGYLTSGKFYQNYDRCWELVGSLRKHIAAIQGAAK